MMLCCAVLASCIGAFFTSWMSAGNQLSSILTTIVGEGVCTCNCMTSSRQHCFIQRYIWRLLFSLRVQPTTRYLACIFADFLCDCRCWNGDEQMGHQSSRWISCEMALCFLRTLQMLSSTAATWKRTPLLKWDLLTPVHKSWVPSCCCLQALDCLHNTICVLVRVHDCSIYLSTCHSFECMTVWEELIGWVHKPSTVCCRCL